MARRRTSVSRYFNRELSWLSFNQRVLEQAINAKTPLLERCKFLAIVTNNLDEFFMIRVAGLKKQLAAGVRGADPAGMTPAEQLRQVARISHRMVREQYRCFNESILPALAAEGIEIVSPDALSPAQRRRATRHFQEVLSPILTPMAIDPGHPFPTLVNNALYLGVRMDRAGSRAIRGTDLAVMQVPSVVPRFLELREARKVKLVPIERLIGMHLAELLSGHNIVAVHPFRLTRDMDLDVDDEVSEDLLKTIEEQLHQLRHGAGVRMNVEAAMDKSLLADLCRMLDLSDDDVYPLEGVMDLRGLWQVRNLTGFDHLRDEPMPPVRTPQIPRAGNILAAIRKGDIFVHHPYYSFDPVVEFLETAAADPKVLAIKQTLYRTTGQSPVVRALKQAALNGKHVTVMVELRARFDEERNIQWAKELEEAGADVIYGLVGLKTHAKALLVVRQEAGGVRRYVHMATGNYNDETARVYTDIGLFSAREDLAEDVSGLFNVITAYSLPPRWNLIEISPTGLRRQLQHLCRREIQLHSAATPGFIRAKVNALSDPDIINSLYEASQAGVRVELLVRGICCLRPGVAGLSENIVVRGIVDRFLEHSRIYHFHAGGKDEVYIASADFMVRNMDSRIEAMVPVLDDQARKQVLGVLDVGFRDNVQAWQLQADGSYVPFRDGRAPLRSQDELYQRARRHAAKPATRRSPAHSLPRPRRRPK